MTSEQEQAVEGFRHAAREYSANPCAGTRYALEMAAAECQLLGLDPSRITSSGYEGDK